MQAVPVQEMVKTHDPHTPPHNPDTDTAQYSTTHNTDTAQHNTVQHTTPHLGELDEALLEAREGVLVHGDEQLIHRTAAQQQRNTRCAHHHAHVSPFHVRGQQARYARGTPAALLTAIGQTTHVKTWRYYQRNVL